MTWPSLRPGAWLLAVEVEVRAGDRAARPRRAARARSGSPSATRRDSVEPSGRPRIARRWFSNWLVAAPSIVQWPGVVDARRELVREQLAADVEELEREHADVAELVEQARAVLLGLAPAARPRRARARCGGSRPRARSRRAGRSASRRRGRGRRAATARGRKRHAPRGHVRGQSPDVSPPDAGPFRRSRAASLQERRETSRPRRRFGPSGSRAAGTAASRRVGPAQPRAPPRPGRRPLAAPPRPARSRTRR